MFRRDADARPALAGNQMLFFSGKVVNQINAKAHREFGGLLAIHWIWTPVAILWCRRQASTIFWC